MKTIGYLGAALAAVIFTLAGCADEPYYNRPAGYSVGTVDRIEVIRKGDQNNVAGTVIGGIVGGLIGHQIGAGSGQTAATIVGATGGAVAGHEVQRRARRSDETFRVTVRFDNGAFETIQQEDIQDLRTGDRVRLEGGRVYRM